MFPAISSLSHFAMPAFQIFLTLGGKSVKHREVVGGLSGLLSPYTFHYEEIVLR